MSQLNMSNVDHIGHLAGPWASVEVKIDATQTMAASFILLQQAEASAAQVLKQAQGAHRRASKALRTAGNNHLLALLEVERLENLANADAYPEHRAHYLDEAAKRTKAAAILRS